MKDRGKKLLLKLSRANRQPGSPRGSCAIKPRNAGDFYGAYEQTTEKSP